MPPHSAAYNMALDAVLLRQQGRQSPPTVRVYRWSEPAVTVGYSMTATDDVDVSGCADAGIAVARRLTGGGVVFHDGAMTFSIVAPRSMEGLPSSAEGLHGLVMARVREALASLGRVSHHATTRSRQGARGPNWCMRRHYCHDLVGTDGKMAGGADRRSASGVLYQGYVSLRPPSEKILRAAGVVVGPSPAFSLAGTDVSTGGTGGAVLIMAEAGVAAALAASLARLLDPIASAMAPEEPTPQEHAAAVSTAESVFGAEAWLLGTRSERRALRLAAESNTGEQT